MLRLTILFECLAEALRTKAARALQGSVPFGDLQYQVAMDTVARLRDARNPNEVHGSLEWAAAAGSAEIREHAEAVVASRLAATPPTIRSAILAYLTHFPPLLRQALRRPSDPAGAKLPGDFVLETPEDLLPFLPPRVPKHRQGERGRGPLSNWELTRLVGMCGFSETWEAKNRDKPTEHTILKYCTDSEATPTLARHAIDLQAAQSLGSLPGLAAPQSFFLDLDPPIVQFESIDGGDFAGMLRDPGGPNSRDQVTRLVARAAHLVGALHRLEQPIVHRGIKPRNLMLQPTGPGKFVVRVVDLGIATITAARLTTAEKLGQISKPEILAASLRGGYTPLYASPQQMRGEPVDVRDDVHALAVLWYQLLVRDVSATPTGRDWMVDLKRGGVPESFAKLILACCSPRLERRPADGEELSQEMLALL